MRRVLAGKDGKNGSKFNRAALKRLTEYDHTKILDEKEQSIFHWLALTFTGRNRKPGNSTGMPSWQQVFDGLVAEEKLQNELEKRGKKEMENVDMTNRAREIWSLIFTLLDIEKSDDPIQVAELKDFKS